MLRVIAALLLLLQSGWLAADDGDRRLTVGARLFTAMLAATSGIEARQAGDGRLLLLIVYQDFPRPADELARSLSRDSSVRGSPVRAIAVAMDELDGERLQQVAGIFIAERRVSPLKPLIDQCRERQIILFSPFDGDVERGVSGGIAISDRILPYVNVRALAAAGLELKPFFMRIAERYE